MIEVLRMGAMVFVAALIFLVGLKLIMNLGLPYAIISAQPRSVSGCLFYELFPMLAVLFVAWAADLHGWLSAQSILLFVFIPIGLSYVHLVAVLMIYGLCKSLWNGKVQPKALSSEVECSPTSRKDDQAGP